MSTEFYCAGEVWAPETGYFFSSQGYGEPVSGALAAAVTECGDNLIIGTPGFWQMVLAENGGGGGAWDLSLEGGALITAAVLGVWVLGWAFGLFARMIRSS